jgi:hypothetical protein
MRHDRFYPAAPLLYRGASIEISNNIACNWNSRLIRKYSNLNNNSLCLNHTTSWADDILWPGNIPSLCHNRRHYY